MMSSISLSGWVARCTISTCRCGHTHCLRHTPKPQHQQQQQQPSPPLPHTHTQHTPPTFFFFGRRRGGGVVIIWMFYIGRARHPGPGPRSFTPGQLSIEFVNVGGFLTSGDLALDSCAQFLAIAEHRPNPLELGRADFGFQCHRSWRKSWKFSAGPRSRSLWRYFRRFGGWMGFCAFFALLQVVWS